MTQKEYDDENFLEDLGLSEDEEDLHQMSTKIVSQAVVNATDWTTETILNQINKGNIDLNPKFQRRDAWEKARKSKFIESLILGLPVPQLVLAENKDKKGSYIVVDGKQRLLTLRQFAAAKSDDSFELLRLSKLAVRDDLKGKALLDLQMDPLLREDLAAFENQSIRTVVIRNWPDENFLYHVFLRLNQGSKPLSPQELRQALHPGPFVDFVDQACESSFALHQILGTKKPDFRMRDVELLIRYYAFTNFLPDYRGNLKAFLDDTCKKLNAEWINRETSVIQQLEEFEAAYITTVKIFGAKDSFKKFSGTKYESRFNRAVFDVMMLTFSKSAVRSKVAPEEMRKQIKEKFEIVCSSDTKFIDSLQVTTKSLDATFNRLSTWIKALNESIDASIPLPSNQNGQINW